MAPRLNVLGDFVEREVVAVDVLEGGQTALAQLRHRRLEGCDVTIFEVEGEGALVAEVGGGPGGGMIERPDGDDG